MTLNKIINELNKSRLNEDLNAIKNMFKNIPEDTFYKLIELDPTYKQGSNSAGKYGKWLLNIYNKGNLKEEDFYKATEYLTKFKEVKEWFTNKDIQQFKTLPQLKRALDNVEIGELSTNQKDKRFKQTIKKSNLNAEKVYEDENWEVWIPKDYEASCKLSSNTEWCTGISSKGNSYHYDLYTKQGPLYIIINKENTNEKYQFHVETNSYMDSYDERIDLDTFFEKVGNGLKDFFLSKDNNLRIEFEEKQRVKDIIENLPDKIKYEGKLQELFDMLKNSYGRSRNYEKNFLIDSLKDPYEQACAFNNFDHENELKSRFAEIKDDIMKESNFTDFLKNNNLTIEDFEKGLDWFPDEDSIFDIMLNCLDETYLRGWEKVYPIIAEEDIIEAYTLKDNWNSTSTVDCYMMYNKLPTEDPGNDIMIHAEYPKELIQYYLEECFIEKNDSDLYNYNDLCLNEDKNIDLDKVINYVAITLLEVREPEDLYYDSDVFDKDVFIKVILDNIKYINMEVYN